MSRMREAGGLVGRRLVGRSFPKKNLGSGVGQKKLIKKTELGEKSSQSKKKNTDQVN